MPWLTPSSVLRASSRELVAGEQLAAVGDVLLYRGHGAMRFAQERGRDADSREQVPGRLIELAHVPHDVHMPHVVAVPGIHHTPVCFYHAVHCVSANSSRPISQRRISEVPAPIS